MACINNSDKGITTLSSETSENNSTLSFLATNRGKNDNIFTRMYPLNRNIKVVFFNLMRIFMILYLSLVRQSNYLFNVKWSFCNMIIKQILIKTKVK